MGGGWEPTTHPISASWTRWQRGAGADATWERHDALCSLLEKHRPAGFSEDLDFTLAEPIAFDELARRLEPVYADVREASGIVFSFEREDRQRHENSYTFYLRYVGPRPGSGDAKVDITLREQLVYPFQERAILRGYDRIYRPSRKPARSGLLS